MSLYHVYHLYHLAVDAEYAVRQKASQGRGEQSQSFLRRQLALDGHLFCAGKIDPLGLAILQTVDPGIGRPVGKDSTLSILAESIERARLGPGRVGDALVEPAAEGDSG